jgi:hypothetical protein
MALMTREQLLHYLREQGFPLGLSTLTKLCAPTVNAGPPVAAWFGRRALYEPPAALEWAKSRLTAKRGNLGIPDQTGGRKREAATQDAA